MHKETGEIRESIKIKDWKGWSEPFGIGSKFTLFGVEMKVVKVKQMRGEIIFKKA